MNITKKEFDKKIIDAFEKAKILKKETLYNSDLDEKLYISLQKQQKEEYQYRLLISTIDSILIQNTGKYVKNYASDIIYDLIAIRNYIVSLSNKENNKENCAKYFIIALRDNGTDGNQFFYSRISNYSFYKEIYNKIFVIKIEKQKDCISVELKEIKKQLAFLFN